MHAMSYFPCNFCSLLVYTCTQVHRLCVTFGVFGCIQYRRILVDKTIHTTVVQVNVCRIISTTKKRYSLSNIINFNVGISSIKKAVPAHVQSISLLSIVHVIRLLCVLRTLFRKSSITRLTSRWLLSPAPRLETIVTTWISGRRLLTSGIRLRSW